MATSDTDDHAWLKTSLSALAPDSIDHPYVGYGLSADTPAPAGAHALVTGPTGAGKTRRVIAPAITGWDGPVVAVSSKPDLIELAAQKRIDAGGEGRTFVLDLSGRLTAHRLPRGAQLVSLDPTALITSDEDALALATELVTMDRSEDLFWESSSQTVLAGLLRAAGTDGIGWTISAISSFTPEYHPTELLQQRSQTGYYGDLDNDPLAQDKAQRDLLIAQSQVLLWQPGLTKELPLGIPDEPSWLTAAMRLQHTGSFTMSARLRGDALSKADRTIGSYAAICNQAVSPWMHKGIAPAADRPVFDPHLLTHPRASLYIVAPGAGPVATAAAIAIGTVVKVWREHQGVHPTLPRLLLAIDELTNTAPLPNLPVLVTEARAMGVSILGAVQSTQQFARRYGGDGMEELRRIFPSILMLTGAHERELIHDLILKNQVQETLTGEMIDHPEYPLTRDRGLLIHNSPPPSTAEIDLRTYGRGLAVRLPDLDQIQTRLPVLPEEASVNYPRTEESVPDYRRLVSRYRQVAEVAQQTLSRQKAQGAAGTEEISREAQRSL